jgi:hypothetical protein
LWSTRNNVEVAYTVPSLVDHADGPTLVQHRDSSVREPGRVAWKTGTRRKWDSNSVPLIGPGGTALLQQPVKQPKAQNTTTAATL